MEREGRRNRIQDDALEPAPRLFVVLVRPLWYLLQAWLLAIALMASAAFLGSLVGDATFTDLFHGILLLPMALVLLVPVVLFHRYRRRRIARLDPEQRMRHQGWRNIVAGLASIAIGAGGYAISAYAGEWPQGGAAMGLALLLVMGGIALADGLARLRRRRD